MGGAGMNELKMGQVTDALGQLVASVVPGARLLRVLPLRPDEGFDGGAEDATAKAGVAHFGQAVGRALGGELFH